MELKTYFAQDRAGNVVPSATVAIYLTGTNTLATGLKTATDAALTNPFTATADGKIQFKAADGIYDMVISYGTQTGPRITIQCLDLVGQVSAAEQAAAEAEAARDQTQQIINDAGEQSTLVVLAQPDGYEKVGGLVEQLRANSITIEAFMEQAGGNVDDALDMAVAYCQANNCNAITLGSGVKYEIYREHDWSAYDNITFRGDRVGVFQNGSVSYGPATPINPANPTESAFLWKGPNSKVWFKCGSQFTFDGIVFGAPGQNFAAAAPGDLVDTGTAIVAKTNLNVRSCVYYGMRNFAEATGQTQVFRDNIGSAYECDYNIINSRDINQVINCHSNPNVFRATIGYVKATISNNSIFVKLNNHDGTHVSNCMTFGKKIAVKNYADTNYLGNLTLNTMTNDFIGSIVDTQTEGGGFISVSNVMAVGGSASNSGSTPDADSGFFVLRKTNVSQIATVDISNTYCNLAASPFTSLPPYLINFQVSEAYAVNLSSVECTRPTDNGAGTFCAINGSVTAAAKSHTADAIRENMIPNAGWTVRHPINGIPKGWTFTNCSVEVDASRKVTATASGAKFGTAFRQWAAARTYIFTSSSVGSSTGVTVNSTASNGTVTTATGEWERRGGKYYCVIYITTEAVFHSFEISAGNQGSTMSFEYAAMVPGSVQFHGSSYSERPPKGTVTGLASYSNQFAAGGTHTIYPDHAGTAGSYTLYLSSTIGNMICNLMKMNPTATPKITVVDSQYAGTNTFTVTWPDNSQPVITSSGAGTVFFTITGVAHSYTY